MFAISAQKLRQRQEIIHFTPSLQGRQERWPALQILPSSSAAKSAVESARFKIAEATGLLERQENRSDETCKELKESNEELSKALQSLARILPREDCRLRPN